MKIKVSRMFLVFVCLFLIHTAFAEAEIGWDDEMAYKPSPIIFLHGFGPGSPDGWDSAVEVLAPYFEAYYKGIEYLNRIDFSQGAISEREKYINRNSSIDTYGEKDFYVSSGDRIAGVSPGWADVVDSNVRKLMDNIKYVSKSPNNITLVAHSMGGLAAREFLTNPKYGAVRKFVDTLITIGSPHLGSPLAMYATGIARSQIFGWFSMPVLFMASFFSDAIEEQLSFMDYIDMKGDAVKDMNPSSDFLQKLSRRTQPVWLRWLLIFGKLKCFDNILLLDSRGGDGVVGERSQRGIVTERSHEVGRVLTLEKDTEFCSSELEIEASHQDEIDVSCSDNLPLLKLIDYQVPELAITYPQNNQVIRDKKDLHIKATVKKEMFPADCYVGLTYRIEGGFEEGDINLSDGKLLRPTEFWEPDNRDSPVGVLDYDLSDKLVECGKYEIIITLENPAGVSISKSVVINIDIPEAVSPFYETWESAEEGEIDCGTASFQADLTGWKALHGSYSSVSAGSVSIIEYLGNKALELRSDALYLGEPENVTYTSDTVCYKDDIHIMLNSSTVFSGNVSGYIAQIPEYEFNGTTYGPVIYATIRFNNKKLISYIFLSNPRHSFPWDEDLSQCVSIRLNRVGDFQFNLWDDYTSSFGSVPHGIFVEEITLSCVNHALEKYAVGQKSTVSVWDNIFIGA